MMTINIAVNGLGRIGRCVVRAVAERNDYGVHLVAVNGTGDIEQYAMLLQYDSVHGKLNLPINIEDGFLCIGRHKIKYLNQKDPELLSWEENKVDVVLECTGKFRSKKTAEKHLKAGARKVIISAPSDDADATIVYGVN